MNSMHQQKIEKLLQYWCFSLSSERFNGSGSSAEPARQVRGKRLSRELSRKASSGKQVQRGDEMYPPGN